MTDAGRWRLVSYAAALTLAVTLGYFLLRIPIQITDSFVNILLLNRPFTQVINEGIQGGYVRPALWAEFKVIYDLSRGELSTWFRWTHVVQVLLMLVFFTNLVQPRTKSAAVVFPLALAVLIGHQHFAGTVQEAFPINAFLTTVVCCGLAASLAFGRHRWWTDVLAVGVFIVAVATVEIGLLVGGIFLVCYALGLRGVSRTGVAAIALLIAAYFIYRFGFIDAATPSLAERETSVGFRRYDGAEVAQLFSGRESVLYAYNVVSSVVGTLFAEPRNGLWRLTRSVVNGTLDIPMLIGALSSTLATALIARYVWLRRVAWRRFDLDRHDRIVLLFILVLGANAGISYAYTKDVIMSPAGFFYAAAVFVACHHYLEAISARPARAVALSGLLLLSSAWTIRAVGLHASLTHTSFRVREQWAYVDEFIARRYKPVPPDVQALRTRLQDDAVIRHPEQPELREPLTLLFEMD